ncbi:MAG: hydrogenase formation protein HypD [Clostridiales Family XIII bacterium]|nr:hydrogenase formation protein HypD [Clostridiales Family XIII bacterium]
MRSIAEKLEYLRTRDGEPLKLMEVCGTHTAGIFRSGIRGVLSPTIRLISGPGCPVCVTPAAYIDRCAMYARMPAHTLACFGDMLKVPGSARSLSEVRAEGGRVEMIYSPFEVLDWAMSAPERTFVIAAVGFETTVPAYGLLMDELIGRGIENVKLLTALKSAIPAIERICQTEESVDGFLCPGHVSVITGSKVYEPLAERYGKPFVVAGFEAEHLVHAIYELTRSAETVKADSTGGTNTPGQSAEAPKKRGSVRNLYGEAVSAEGNPKARRVMERYFKPGAAVWRGLGEMDASGLYLRGEYRRFDAGSRGLDEDGCLPDGCLCADVITGRIDPDACPMFGGACVPGNAQGPCMVSSEGACGIWYQNASGTFG